MVGFTKPSTPSEGWHADLEELDVANLLSLDPYERRSYSILKTQFNKCALKLHSDHNRPGNLGYIERPGVSMMHLNMVRCWVRAAGGESARCARWDSMWEKARNGWHSNWNADGDLSTQLQPILAYTRRFPQRAPSSASNQGDPAAATRTPGANAEVVIIDLIVRDRERRPYHMKRKRNDDDGAASNAAGAGLGTKRRSGRRHTPRQSYDSSWHPMDEHI